MSNQRKGRVGAAQPARTPASKIPARTGVHNAPPVTVGAQSSSRRMLLLALLAGALIVFAAGWFAFQIFSNPPAPVVPSAQGRIAFVRKDADGKRNLYVVNPDGTNQQRALENVDIEGSIQWSPDGGQMLLQVSVNGTSTVVRVDIGPNNRGTNAVQLTADAKGDSVFPSWSPDGTQIAFQSKRDGGDYQVFVMDRDGNNKRRISSGKGYAGQPAWSADGKTLAFVGGETQTSTTKDLYLVPVAGGDPKKLTNSDMNVSSPEFSPDGKSLLYVNNQGDLVTQIMVANADGSNPRAVVTQSGNRNPVFSPDSTKIAYYSISQSSGSDVMVVPAAGGATENLTHNSTEDYEPAWSYDGKELTWASKTASDFKIVVGDSSGAHTTVVSTGAGTDYQPVWGAPLK